MDRSRVSARNLDAAPDAQGGAVKIADKRLAVIQGNTHFWKVVIYTSKNGGNPVVTGRMMAAKKDFTFDALRTHLVRVSKVHSVVKG